MYCFTSDKRAQTLTDSSQCNASTEHHAS